MSVQLNEVLNEEELLEKEVDVLFPSFSKEYSKTESDSFGSNRSIDESAVSTWTFIHVEELTTLARAEEINMCD
ncbi:hypothetical protein HDU96_007191, partial [Phlyctochytrium bullatum]